MVHVGCNNPVSKVLVNIVVTFRSFNFLLPYIYFSSNFVIVSNFTSLRKLKFSNMELFWTRIWLTVQCNVKCDLEIDCIELVMLECFSKYCQQMYSGFSEIQKSWKFLQRNEWQVWICQLKKGIWQLRLFEKFWIENDCKNKTSSGL